MDNAAKIKALFGSLRKEVNTACIGTLKDVMPAVLKESLSLHETLEEGLHTHHLTTADTHGYAVAHGSELLDSGRNEGAARSKGGSAKEEAEAAAIANGGEYKGSFVATMDFDFLSLRFETKVQEALISGLKDEIAPKFREVALASRGR